MAPTARAAGMAPAARAADRAAAPGPRPAGPVLIIAGPTASGKSALALDAALAFRGTVINADSLQVYAELSILTARPGPAALAAAPHRLYGVLPAREPCSAARWRDLALTEIALARADGRLPVVVGGTGLYLRALTQGLASIPVIPEPVRAAARALGDRLGAAGLHARLAARDPDTASRLAPGDTQRVVRAWEVLEATGRPLSAWQAGPGQGPPPDLTFVSLVLDPPRPLLYAACDGRFQAMIAAGAVAEVQHLAALGLDPALPAMKALGVPELLRHAAGEIGLEAAIAQAQQATRRYAKRQSTWFRHQGLAPRQTGAAPHGPVLPGLYRSGQDHGLVATIGQWLDQAGAGSQTRPGM